MLCFSVVLSLLRLAKVGPKSEVVRRLGCPRCRQRAREIWKSKSLKTGMPGALLEVAIDKICTTPARESDLEVEIVKNWQARITFGS